MRFVLCFILLAVRSGQANDTPKELSELFSQGKSLLNKGDYSAAAHAFREALAVGERSSINDRQLAELHSDLAASYAEAGKFSESAGGYRRVLALLEKTEGQASLNYAVLLATMAVLPTQPSATEPVIAALRHTLAVNARIDASENLILVRECLALILSKHNRYQEEEPLLLDALADLAKQKTPDARLLGGVLNDLAMLRLDQGRYRESIDLQQQSIGVLETALGREHPSLVVLLSDLATTYVKMGHFDDARLTYVRAIALCGKTLGENHLDYAALLENYAVALQKLGRKSEARKVKRQGQQIMQAADRRNGIGSTISVAALRSAKN